MVTPDIRPVQLMFFGRTFFAIRIWIVTQRLLSVLPNVESLVFSWKSDQKLDLLQFFGVGVIN